MRQNILMADVVQSGERESKKLMTQFKSLVSTVNNNFPDHILSPLTITLGDEFQGILNSFCGGLEIIFFMEELIIEKNFDIKLRYVLLIGNIETTVNSKVAYEMLGPGLTSAREKLDLLKKEDIRFFVSRDKDSDIFINKSFLIYQSLIDSWKPKDLKAVTAFLQHEDYKIVSKKIKTDTSSAWRRKRSLKINEYNTIKEIIYYITNIK